MQAADHKDVIYNGVLFCYGPALWLGDRVGEGWVLWVRVVPRGDPSEGQVEVAEVAIRRSVEHGYPIPPSPLHPVSDDDLPLGGLSVRAAHRYLGAATPILRRFVQAIAASDDRWDELGEGARSVLNPAMPKPCGLSGSHGRFPPPTAFEAPRRRGPVRKPERHYALVAQAYVEKLEAGSAHPLDELRRERNYSLATIRDWLTTARRLGLLTPSPPGKAGGRLTDKARDLLAGKKPEPEGEGVE